MDSRNQSSDLRKQNPLKSHEKISRYPYPDMYQSIYYHARDCPCSGTNKSQENKVTLLSQEAQECFLQHFLGKTFNLAVLDSGCTKTVPLNENHLDAVRGPSKTKRGSP